MPAFNPISARAKFPEPELTESASQEPTSRTHCVLVVALLAEATPLIERFKLQSQSDCVFRTWSSDEFTLVVSGIGKLKAAAATAATLTARPKQTVCVNIGIAGSDREKGELVMAHCIRDKATDSRWYPPQISSSALETITVVTLDSISNHYQHDEAFEMEAAGFFQAAIMFSTAELVQCLKVISDNPQHPFAPGSKPPKATAISQLIENRLDAIVEQVDKLKQIAQQLPDSLTLDSMMLNVCSYYHLSVTEQHALRRLLQRRLAIAGTLPAPDELNVFKNGKLLIRHLEQSLQQRTISY